MLPFTKPANDIFSPVDAAGKDRSIINIDVQRWGTEVESMIAAFQAGGGVIFPDLETANGALDYAPNTMAWVFGDAVVANNGIYRKVGASGSGSWGRLGDLPYSFIRAINSGDGTPNAIQATTSMPIPTGDGGALITVNVVAENTGPVTVSFNGDAPLSIKTSSGNNPVVGGLVAGMTIAGYKVGSEFRMLSDQASAAIVSAAEAAAAEAEGYRDEAAGYATLALSNWVVDTFTGDGTDDPLVLTVNPGSINNCVIIIEGEGPQPRHIFSIDGRNLSPPAGSVWPDGKEIEVAYGTAIEVGAPADGTVTESKLGTDSVSRIKVRDGAIGSSELDDDAVNADHIDPAAVTAIVAKLGMTRVAFSAHKNGTNQTGIASATATKITFGTERFDDGGYYDPATSRFTPPAGKYRLSATLFTGSGMVDQSVATAMIYKNGSRLARAYLAASGTTNISPAVTTIVSANGTDYFEVYFEAFGAGDKAINGEATSTWFCGEAV